MDACILNISFSLCRKLLSEIRSMLILDIFDDGIPTIAKKWQREINLAELSNKGCFCPLRTCSHIPSVIID